MRVVLDSNQFIFALGRFRLVSENRHFLSLDTDLPFRIVKAEDAIRILSEKVAD